MEKKFDFIDHLESMGIRLPKPGREPLALGGLYGASKSLLAAALLRRIKAPCLIVTFDMQSAETLLDEIVSLLDQERRFFGLFNDLDDDDLLAGKQDPEAAASRLHVLSRIVEEKSPVVVAPCHAALRRTVAPQELKQKLIRLTPGLAVSRDELIARFVELGYRREEGVDEAGGFTVRGDVLLVRLPVSPHPVRIDFLDDEIESLSLADLEAGARIEFLDAISIPPLAEFVPRTEQIDELRRFNRMLTGFEVDGKPRYDPALLETHLDHFQMLKPFSGVEFYGARLYRADLFDYFADGFVFFDEAELSLRNAEKHIDSRSAMTPEGFPGAYNSLAQLGARLPSDRVLRLENGAVSEPGEVFEEVAETAVNLPIRPVPWEYRGIVGLRKLAGVPGLERIYAFTRQYHRIEGHLLEFDGLDVRNIRESLYKGFMLGDGVMVLTDHELFGDRLTSRGFTGFDGMTIGSIEDLAPGELVVHIHHGVGRFEGIKRMETAGAVKDFFEISYRNDDRLFLPLNQISRLRKYVGADGDRPKLNRLGTGEWARTREKVKKGIRHIAIDLLELYKRRSAEIGFAHPPDTPWQHELESDFPYEETFDQLKAIDDVKSDMEADRVMDRLLCGDVGYGKTEVALRAAFKAVQAGKQVALLVPTTILALQHYNTFRERLDKFHVTVDMLSRFRTAGEQTATIERLASGEVDMVVGTHRLLQKDIKFRDIGLMIVDEEQRFGVEHKEKLKTIKSKVDVLTMTATPIPRTLQMSLVGVRDMSIIETPPKDRKAVRTFIMEFNAKVAAQAIKAELNRRGQVYYLYNKIEDIHKVEEMLTELIPEASVAVAHGRMKEDVLEDIMYKFTNGIFDVLLCTTIIENGMDIPNVNTLIVDGAERLGLSQMYQLRGRVGRSSRDAYAYFLHGPVTKLADASKQRLSAIRDFTELGSGFRIAMRDLEIRGAGNILGPEQHGFINAVGFDMFCEILNETVNELKGMPAGAKFETTVDLAINGYIPTEFMPNGTKRAAVYRRMAVLDSVGEMNRFHREMLKKHPAMPPEMENLFKMLRIKFLAEQLKIAKLHSMEAGDTVRGLFAEPASVDEDDAEEVDRLFSGRVRLDRERFFLDVGGLTQEEQLFYLRQLLEHLANRFSARPVKH